MKTTMTKFDEKCRKASYMEERSTNKLTYSQEVHKLAEDWKDDTGLDIESFAQRLAFKKLSYNEFLGILSDKNSPLISKEQKWINIFNNIFSSENLEYLGMLPSTLGLTIPIIPFITYFESELKKNFQTEQTDYFDLDSISKQLANNLLEELKMISSKLFVLDFSKYEGNTSFSYHRDKYLRDKYYILELLEQYPVLIRIMTEITARHITNSSNILKRYIEDSKMIKKTMRINHDSTLEKISLGVGDSHKNGQSVAIIEFSCGEKIIYKPRSLKIDVRYQELLSWFNHKELKYNLNSVISIDRGQYGWQEFIEHERCFNKEQVTRYYYRIGALMGIFYLLGTTDLHYENIIASGENPFVIDLETLFSNSITDTASLPFPLNELYDSVFKSGLLPSGNIFKSNIDFDLSGITGTPNQKSDNMRGWVLVNDNKDDIQFKNLNFVTSETSHLVYLKDERIDAYTQLNEIQEGFTDIYNIILSYKETFFSEVIEKLFRSTEYRIILRPTHVYHRFLVSSHHPKYLKDALDRERLLDLLWNLHIKEPVFKEVANYEVSDLLNNDIPYFTSLTDSKDLLTSGKKHIRNILNETALEKIQRNLLKFSHEDLNKQLSLIGISLEESIIRNKPISEVETLSGGRKIDFSSHRNKSIREICESIGDYFIDKGFNDSSISFTAWAGMENDSDKDRFKLRMLEPNLYGGSLGISLFLANLGRITGKEIYTIYSRNSINFLLDRLAKVDSNNLPLAIYNGLGSIVYTLNYLAILWCDSELDLIAQKYTQIMNSNWESVRNDLDYLKGLPGIISLNMSLYNSTKDQEFLQYAIMQADALVEQIEHQAETFEQNEFLLGFAHGSSGIIYALSKLNSYTNQRYLKTIVKLLSYEDKKFNEESMNWPDLREGSYNSFYWCHGAPGIILSRKYLDRSLQISSIDFYEKILLQITSSTWNRERLGLCHGVFGILDIILCTPDLSNLNKDYVLDKTIKLLNDSDTLYQIESLKEKGIMGSMLGISGIGYFLLRLVDEEIPSLLTLDLPKMKDEFKRV
ncbi:type 2 lanthipeptide synthetase LanM family protein [Priestia endophytica]|uniref:type 2 lanthipeptide synthetase LanM family protein n=1 Tax=Priestia endophytica TaxID=135735 RepID=UPI00124EAC3A|nr:type 2 lanthipeptide synthetase LanM family protein [Priestia endophytica]KAB2489473.1 type 2 lantipeptide synthetase LanM [Priestia endophytica]